MRTTYLVGGVIVASLAFASAAAADQGPGGSRPEGEARVQAQFRGPGTSGQVRVDARADAHANEPTMRGPEGELRGRLMEALEDRRGMNATFTAQVKAKGVDVAQLIGQHREEAAQRIQKVRDDFRAQLKTGMQAMQETRQERRAALESKLEAFKDGNKQEIAARIDTSLSSINERWTAFFANTVDRIEAGLDAIESRADKAEASGKDVSAVRVKIDAAAAAIASARVAITGQADNDYTLSVQDETTVKADAQEARDALKDDLDTVRTAVRAAFNAAVAAAKELRDVPGIADVNIQASTTAN